jgi:CHAD domain-containing protein
VTARDARPEGLERWVNDVLVLQTRAARALRVEVVHDLRVAIRRCRSLAQGLKEIDDDIGAVRWKALSDAGRGLFQGLGDLRDAQVMREHAARLLREDGAHDDVLAALDRRIKATKEHARIAVTDFDANAWRVAAAGLPQRAAALLCEGQLFDHLVLRRFLEAKELHQSAMRNRGATALHELRIGIKKLRYTVENFLPDAHEQIGKVAKTLQEILGDVHDLDVLVAFLGSEHLHLHSDDRSRAASLVRSAREQLVLDYHALTVGPESAWPKLRAAFVTDAHAIERAHTTVIERKASARVDAAESRALLRASFDLLRALRTGMHALNDRRAPELLRRACACALVDGGGRAARRFVEDLPAAIGFSGRDRAVLAVVARAAVDRAPAVDDKRVVALLARDRPLALAAGAVVHLAVALVPTAPFVVRGERQGVIMFDVSRPLQTPDAARSFAERRAPLEALVGVPLWTNAAHAGSDALRDGARGAAKAAS